MSEDAVEKREIPIEWKGRKETVVIRRLNFGEWGDITDATTDVKMVGTVKSVKINSPLFKQMAIKKSVVKAPFKTDSVQDVRAIPSMQLGNLIYDEIEKFNGLTEEKKEG